MDDKLRFFVEFGLSRHYVDEDKLVSYLKQAFYNCKRLCQLTSDKFDGETFCRIFTRDETYFDD